MSDQVAANTALDDSSASPPPSIFWCVHVRGGDDVYPTRSYEDALKIADWITERFDRFDPAADLLMPFLRAVPALWPWSAESHAAGLAATDAEWLVTCKGEPLPTLDEIIAMRTAGRWPDGDAKLSSSAGPSTPPSEPNTSIAEQALKEPSHG